MSFVIPRHGRVLASVVTAGLLLAGCAPGPSRIGAAALIGNSRIPVSEVQSQFDQVLRAQPRLAQQWQQQGQFPVQSRQLASYLVRQELLDQTARQEHIGVSEQQITDAINSQGGAQKIAQGTLLTPDQVRGSVRSSLLATELGRKYVNRLAVTFEYTQATNRREAQTKAQRMAQGPQEAAAVLQNDRAQGIPVSSNERLRPADGPDVAAMTPLFGAPPGTVLAFETQPQSGQWVIARIMRRDTSASGPPAANVNAQTLEGIGMRLLGITADRVGVRLSPRYGVWDPINLSAAANANETTGFWIDPRATTAS